MNSVAPRKFCLSAAIGAAVWALVALWMNVPAHPFTDSTEIFNRINTPESHVFVDRIYLLSGFPIFYPATEIMHDGTERFRPDSSLIVLNSVLCLVGVASVFIWLTKTRVSLRLLLGFVTACAFLVAISEYAYHTVYFYVVPCLYFLPIAFLGLRGVMSFLTIPRVRPGAG
ncbi:hypothetical protein FYK55_17180 [Roseiconus nitratireducens]|uniref:Uncharacterized protein n=1 Tax=Roseiconus nitratireducens TaxID=2605748 RepID=A0A5M6D346_9BACT|nr:hypothetical protein [Roseiconus nitratireducens]KAA5541928.1 hypothetical protein FYK55_17180 [Roseiconus nitratireducens]